MNYVDDLVEEIIELIEANRREDIDRLVDEYKNCYKGLTNSKAERAIRRAESEIESRQYLLKQKQSMQQMIVKHEMSKLP